MERTNFKRLSNSYNAKKTREKCNVIFFVTHDKFLFFGLKYYFPDLIMLEPSSYGSIFEHNLEFLSNFEYSVIFDNRITLRDFHFLMKTFFNTTNCISSMLLEMHGKKCARMFIGEKPKVSSRTKEGIVHQIKNNIHSKVKINKKNTSNRYSLSDREYYIIKSMLSGYTLKDVSKDLIVSEKRLYAHCSRLYERFECGNFNEACLFIFRNGIMEHCDTASL